MTVKRETISDGIFSATLITVDATDDSKEAGNALFDLLDANSTPGRIAALERFLNDLPSGDPVISPRAEKIREALSEINPSSPGLLGLEKLKNAEMWRREISVLRGVVPLARKGSQFPPGKPKGSIGPVAKKIKAYLAKHPEAKPPEVWDNLKNSPPKDHVFMESTKLGKYIEKGPETVMEWRRFCNLVSEHRPKNI